MNRSTILFSGLLSLCAQISAQTGKSFTLAEAQAYAVQNSYQVQQQKIDLDIARSRVRQTTAIGLPQVNAEATYNNFIDIPTQVAPASAFNPLAPADALAAFQFGLPQSMSAGITASQLIFDGSYFVGLRASKEYVKTSEIGLARSEADVKSSVAQTYISALAAQENIDALKENKANIEKIYKETSALYEVGFLEKQDADQMKLLTSNVTNQLEFAERQYQNVLDALKFQLGMPHTETITLTDNIEALLAQQTAETTSLLEQPIDPSRNHDFKAVEQGVKLNELALSNARAKNLPQLGAFFTHSQNAFRNDFDFMSDKKWYPTTLWGLKLTVPIFSSGNRFETTRQAKLELARVQSQKNQLEQSLYMQGMSARNQYKSAYDRYNTVKEDLLLAKSIKERTLIKYNTGMASSAELTQSESQYLTALGNYINTTMELLTAKINLDKVLGN